MNRATACSSGLDRAPNSMKPGGEHTTRCVPFTPMCCGSMGLRQENQKVRDSDDWNDTVSCCGSRGRGRADWSGRAAEGFLEAGRSGRRREVPDIPSNDYGATWQAVGRSGDGKLPNCTVTDVCPEPDSPLGSRHLWAATFGRGVRYSEDGGSTWRERNEGFGANANLLRIRRNAHGHLYAMTTMRAGRGTVSRTIPTNAPTG